MLGFSSLFTGLAFSCAGVGGAIAAGTIGLALGDGAARWILGKIERLRGVDVDRLGGRFASLGAAGLGAYAFGAFAAQHGSGSVGIAAGLAMAGAVGSLIFRDRLQSPPQ